MLSRILLFLIKPQHKSAIGMSMSPPSPALPIPLHPTPSHPSRLRQSPCLSSLRHAANSYWLSLLHMVIQVSRLLSACTSQTDKPQICLYSFFHFPGRTSGKAPTCPCRRRKRPGFDPWVGKIPWRRAWQPSPVFFPGESRGQGSPVGYKPWDCKEQADTH